MSHSRDRPVMLLAEDDEALRHLHTLRFELDGYSVFSAADGEEALALLEAAVPTVIVTDWMMPRVNGLELCRHVRAQLHLLHVPVVLLTAYLPTPEVQELIDNGDITFLSKTTPWREILATLHNLLARAPSLPTGVEPRRRPGPD